MCGPSGKARLDSLCVGLVGKARLDSLCGPSGKARIDSLCVGLVERLGSTAYVWA